MIELAQKCINGQNHSFNATVTGNFSSPSPGGIGPGGSGPIQNDEEMICDILTELISTLFKMYSRLLEQEDLLKTSGTVESLMENQKQQTLFENVELMQNL